MKKKILSVVITLCMVISLMPTFTLPANAVGGGALRTTTLDLTSATEDTSSVAEGWTWVQSTKTLTLSGVTIQIPSSTSGDSYGIKLPKESTITLAAGSVNTVKAGDVTEAWSYGIHFAASTSGNLVTNTINGTGKLFVIGGKTTGASSRSYGIFCNNYTGLSIADVNLYVTGGTATLFSCAISAGRQVDISGGTITATGGSATYSLGISTSNDAVTISGGTVTAIGGSATSQSIGIQSFSNINVLGGTVTSMGGTVTGALAKSIGLQAFNYDVVISGGKVIATGGTSSVESYGICAKQNCSFSDGISIVRGGLATTSNAVKAETGTVTNPGTNIIAGTIAEKYALIVPTAHALHTNTARTTTLDLTSTTLSYIFTTGTKTVNATAVNITDSAEGWAWAFGTKTLTLSGVNINASDDTAIKLPADAVIVLDAGSVNVAKAGDGINSYGIYGAGALTINGTGELVAIAGNVTNADTADGSYGIVSAANLILGASDTPVVTALGGTAADGCSQGIGSASAITVINGTITATGGTAKYYSYGIQNTTNTNITISGGTVTATSGSSSSSCYGIRSKGSIVIQGGTTYATSGTASNLNAWSNGIYSANDFTIDAGALIAATGYATDTFAIFSNSNFTQAGGQVIAISDATDGTGLSNSKGIFGRNSCAFNGGTARAYSGIANWSHAVYAETDNVITFGSPAATAVTLPAGAGISGSGGRFIAITAGGTTPATAVRIEAAGITGTPTVAVTNGYGAGSNQIKIGAALTAMANTTPGTNLSYQWEVSSNGTDSWANATGAGNAAAAYTVNAVDAAKYLRVKVTSSDAAGSVTSAASAQVPYTITLSKSGNTGTDDVSFSSSSSVTTTYAAGTAVTVYYTLSGGGTLSNTLSYIGATITQITTPGTSSSTYTINSTDASSGVIAIAAAFVHNNSTDNGSDGSGGFYTPPPTNGAAITVNGNTQTAGTVSTTTTDGRTTTTITVDDTKLEQLLENTGSNATVTIPSASGSDVIVGAMNGQTIKTMEEKEAVLEIKIKSVTYTLPASQINIDEVSAQLGDNVQLKDIKISVSISEPSANTVKIVEDTANKNSYQIIVRPIEFEITCSSGGKAVNVFRFNGYVERTIAIPDGVDPSKITTGIVLNNDGTFSHVPTTIVLIDGKYYAKINSLTNSTYAVIYHQTQFNDLTDHWAKDIINEMGSRLIVNGDQNGNYNPDSNITRAEFAAIIVRALGLTANGTASFADVSENAWYYGAVGTAYQYGIVGGKGSNKFDPNANITREEAMAMIYRASKLTSFPALLNARNLSAEFGDYGTQSGWADEGVAFNLNNNLIKGSDGKINPKADITRAEVATVVLRLLQRAGLIDVRTVV